VPILVFFLASDTKCSHALISMEDSEWAWIAVCMHACIINAQNAEKW